MTKSILRIDIFEELVLEQSGGGCPRHVLEQEEHAIEQLHLGIAEKANVKSSIVKADIDDLILPLLHVLHALNLVDVNADQAFLEGQVWEQLHDLGQHHIPVLEDS